MLPDETVMLGIDTQLHGVPEVVLRLFAVAVFAVYQAQVIVIEGSLWLSPYDLLQNAHSLWVIVTQVLPPGEYAYKPFPMARR